jgi:hypothetical protein
MKRSAKGYNGTTAMSRQSPDVTIAVFFVFACHLLAESP